MKKGLIAAGIIIVIIAAILVIFYKPQDVEFAGGGVNEITTSGIDMVVLACNPSPFTQSIDLMEAVLYFQSNDIGTLEVTGKEIQPHSQSAMTGTITFQDFDSMKNFVGWMVNGQNPSDFQATVLVKTKMLNLIPYSYKKTYDFAGFEDLLFGSKQWSCQQQGIVTESAVKQQLILAHSRLNAAQLLYSNNINITNNQNSTTNQNP